MDVDAGARMGALRHDPRYYRNVKLIEQVGDAEGGDRLHARVAHDYFVGIPRRRVAIKGRLDVFKQCFPYGRQRLDKAYKGLPGAFFTVAVPAVVFFAAVREHVPDVLPQTQGDVPERVVNEKTDIAARNPLPAVAAGKKDCQEIVEDLVYIVPAGEIESLVARSVPGFAHTVLQPPRHAGQPLIHPFIENFHAVCRRSQ